MPAQPCDFDCRCGKHRPVRNLGGQKCQPGCTCARHRRTAAHNARIGASVSLTAEAKRWESRRG